ncbi:hypothetical protein V6N11_044457 [Hibiscus sabdariffa]|uniref:Retrotransposon gag domain-containing protein n=1 Tax=Hibiscus sabdariffa TaxID=183260 RepID=A0ABR2RF85_9ROSI
MQIVSLGKARRQGGTKYNNCSTQICAFLVWGIGTRMVVSVPIPLWNFEYRCRPTGTGTISLWYRYLRMGIGTVRQGLSCGMVRPRRSVRGGGQAPERLDEVEIEQGIEETLPPPPLISGEAYEGGVGSQAGVEPQVAQGPAVSSMTPLIQAIVRAFQTTIVGVQRAAQPQGQMGCTDVRKLGCVVFLLQGDAYAGWTMVISGLDGDEITWEFFQLAYRKKNLGTRYENEEKREFVALVQGSMSMSEYEIQL